MELKGEGRATHARPSPVAIDNVPSLWIKWRPFETQLTM